MFNPQNFTRVPEPNNILAWELHKLLAESGYTVRFREVADDTTELRVRGGDRAIIGIVCRGCDRVTAWTVADDAEFLNFFGMAGEEVEVAPLLPAIMQEAGTNQYQRRMAAARAARDNSDTSYW